MDTKYVHIFTGSMIEVNRLVSDLSEANIKSIVEDEGKSAVLAGFALPNLSLTHRPVSYTHLTLPTILLV